MNIKTEQIVSKKRVADHGEVFTAAREVNAMLDLVKQETLRIDSRFLEPACGKGAFLAEVLRRKLGVVEERYAKSPVEYERYAILALSSIYGIDILEDNVFDCRKELFNIFKTEYEATLKCQCNSECLKSAQFILTKNIVWGDALTLKRVDLPDKPIVFAEWSAVNGKMLKRRDFTFSNLLNCSTEGLPLFSDTGEDVWLPVPVREFPITHYLKSLKLKRGYQMPPKNYNPDVLSCLANLSNDEVFTPPQLANQILDMLPQDLFTNKETRFLDPCCKSGVFLREIAKRLIVGLEKEIPDLEARLNHIYTKQLFGIAITELTALLSRRSVYCSKQANSQYSICNRFSDEEGNIHFERTPHTWENGRCKYCGASQSEYDRDDTLETHAYQFIHNPKELLK